jgi:signal transduction histidine kinase
MTFLSHRTGTIAGRKNPWTPPFIEDRGLPGWVLANLAATALYFLLALIVSRFFAAYGLFPAPIWLPTGGAMVAAMIGDLWMFPGIFLGSFLANDLLFAPPLHISLIISATNALGPVVGALALIRLRPKGGLFTSFAGVISFLVCTTFLCPAITASGGAVAMAIGKPLDWPLFYSTLVNWWLTDSGGTLYLAPALVLWLGLEGDADAHLRGIQRGFGRRDLAVWAWIAVISLLLFLTPPLRGSNIRSAFPFLLVVPLSWIALRMSLRSAYTLVSLVAIVATAGTVAGYGPFQNHSLANPLQLVGTLVVLLAMNVLTIVALVSERHEAENANKVKSMFLAKTSHELRTPLNAIIGFSSLFGGREAELASNADKYGEYARLIQSSGEYLLALINDLLEMSKIEAGRIELRDETLSLGETLEEALALIEVQARAKAIILKSEIVTRDARITADAKALRQVLLNILSNAVKFTPEGGVIALAAHPGAEGALAIRVTDSGVGIPADAIERVFLPFERAHRDGKHPIEGTGLGLAIARGLVELHGGSIALDSTLGQGTTVTIMLPAHRVLTWSGASMRPRALAS